jgi:adenine-specific DNA methylase
MGNPPSAQAKEKVEGLFARIPFGVPTECLPSKEALGFRVPLYGFDQWGKLFTRRQLVAIVLSLFRLAMRWRND